MDEDERQAWDELDEAFTEELYAFTSSCTEVLFEYISSGDIVIGQQSDTFWVEIQQRINDGARISVTIDNDGILYRTAETKPQIVIPPELKARILHISHHARLYPH